ncbi:MAG: histidine phosphatase family protein [Anaerolineaceae bacterium]
MQLYFIRHGQSENNAIWLQDAYVDYRIADPLLTEQGKEQARLLSEFLAVEHADAPEGRLDWQNRRGFGITHMYCSLMERAVQTGAILSERLGIPLVGVPDLHELGGIYLEDEVDGVKTYQILHGRDRGYLNQNYPNLHLFAEISEGGWWRGGREERAIRMERAHRMVEFLKDRHAGTEDRVAVVTHGAFFSYMFRVLLSLDLNYQGEKPLPYEIMYNNCGITRFDLIEDEVVLMYHNRTDFLPAELVT